MATSRHWAGLVAGLWAGVLLCIAFVATPAPFATLAQADAGRVVGRILAQEAYLSVAASLVLLLIERRRTRPSAGHEAVSGAVSVFSANLMLILGALFCTVAGYFAVQPMMAAARAGQGPWSFGTLHAVSGGLFAVKGLLVLALAWRLTAVEKIS